MIVKSLRLSGQLVTGLREIRRLRRAAGEQWYLAPHGRARIQRWMGETLAALGIEVSRRGEVPDEPRLWVANHSSWLDILLLGATQPLSFVSKAEVARWPLLGPLAAGSGTLFLDRGRAIALRRLRAEVGARLRAAQGVALFPEGTTTFGDAVGGFSSALFEAAREAGVAIQPVAIRLGESPQRWAELAYAGDRSFVANLGMLLRQRRLCAELTLLPPIDPGVRSRRALADSARDAIAAALGLP